MSAAIPVRLADGQILEVPPMRLSWASEHPELVEMVDTIGRIAQGQAPEMSTAQRLAAMTRFIDLVREVAGVPAERKLLLDVADVAAVHMALRGCVPPDPTAAARGG